MPKERKPFWRRLLEFRLLLVINLAVISLLGLSLVRETIRNREIASDIAELQAQADELAARNLQIAELGASFQTESFIEGEARLRLGMKRPGEQMVIVTHDQGEGTFPDASGDPSLAYYPGESPAISEETPNTRKWWAYLFDRRAFERYVAYEDR